MLDDQDANKKNADDTAANDAATPDVKTGPEEVTEATEEVQDTESVIEEPKIETPTDKKPKEGVDYDTLPSEEAVVTEPEKDAETESELASDSPSEQDVPDNPNAKWYVVHTYSGHENKVASALKQRIESEHLEHKILDVLVPTQDKIEIKAGKKEQVKEKIFPGYILVKMVLDDASWLAVRTTQGVTSFVGIGNKPTPIPEHEVKTIVRFMSQGATSTFKDVYQINDTIKIIDGPFSDFIGKVDTVDKEKGKVRVLVSIFGRETPVELDFLQVQKL